MGYDNPPYQAQSSRDNICHWLGHMKLSRIIILVSVLLFTVPLVTHYYLSKFESSSVNGDIYRTRSKLEALEDFSTLTAQDLKIRIEEMLRIKGSVSAELRELESKRQKLQQELASQGARIDLVKQDHLRQQTELDRLKISVEQAQFAQHEAMLRNTPDLAPPIQISATSIPDVRDPLSPSSEVHCRMFSCFDHSRCPLTSGFPVYLYDPEKYSVVERTFDVDGFLKTTIKQTMGYNAHLTRDPKKACVYVVLLGEAFPTEPRSATGYHQTPETNKTEAPYKSPLDFDLLKSLPFWGGDGRNHLLVNLARRDLSVGSGNVFSGVSTGRAMLVQSIYLHQQFRDGFDLIVPPMLGPPGGEVWQECAPMVPARRKYLLSFQGEMKSTKTDKKSGNVNEKSILQDMTQVDNFVVEYLKHMTKSLSTSDEFFFQFKCVPATEQRTILPIRDWSLCGTDYSRKSILKDSTFVLIMSPGNQEYVSTSLLQARLYEGLRSGAIPVILGGDQILLPYSEVVDWKKCVILLPKTRITELHFFLRAIPDNDLLSFRKQGRMVWEKYLSSVQATVDTVIATVRHRLNIPPRPIESTKSTSVFNASFAPLRTEPVLPDSEPEESLGPIEAPYASPSYKRNYTLMLTQGHEVWNDWGDPFNLYPQLPFDTFLSSDAKFMGSPHGFRPIGKGAGGAGKEFCESLGGNHPREQFTIVILTYEREQVLMSSISRLYGLPYLNKVVVVWNSPKPPAEELRWPDIGVPVVVVKAARNSLNNRFLPYDVIETEAILSVDDDAHLRHDEIMFGFRVWREHRDRIVGFPGRFHAWDLNFNNGFLYNSNYSCELSMVLTGAAFVHKYYAWLYWRWLPQAVRDKVDELMNCEDIAMNFLVAHLTRKPPVKVTSRWTFRCPGCPVTLSSDETHFNERHKCINFFSQVFGYTPLLNTQYRADSILFKTRIPHDKQKCFKFI